MNTINSVRCAPCLFVAVVLTISGCGGQSPPPSAGSAQALKALEIKTGLTFPTNTALVSAGDGGGREASHQFYEWAVFSPTQITLPKTVAPGVQDYLKLPLKDTTDYVQSRMRQQIMGPQAAFSTEWKTNGFGFSATVVRGAKGDFLVITQGRI